MIKKLLIMLLVSVTFNCKSNKAVNEIETFNLNNETISEKYSDCINFGTCLTAGEYGNNSIENTKEELLNQYNLFVSDNAMKPYSIRMPDKTWNWEYADNFMKFTKSKNSLIRDLME